MFRCIHYTCVYVCQLHKCFSNGCQAHLKIKYDLQFSNQKPLLPYRHAYTHANRYWISRENTRCVLWSYIESFRNANFHIHDGTLYLLMPLFCCLTRFFNVIPWRYLLRYKLLLSNVLKLYSFHMGISSCKDLRR